MANETDNLKMLSACPLCEKALGRDDMALIFQQDSRTIFHATCPKCSVSALILFSIGQRGVWGAGMLTDLSQEETKEKLKMGKISADEVIEIYKSVSKT